MKLFTKVLLIILLCYPLTYAQLVGGTTYQINGVESPPTSFQNITTAVAYLTTNGVTGTGQVILELNTGYAGTEPGPVNIGAITGTSSTLGITFRPAASYTAVTEIVGGATPNQHAINLAGSNYITLDGRSGGVGTDRNWTVKVTGANGQMAVRLNNTTGNMTSIIVRNLIMIGEASNTTGAVFQITGNTTNTMTDVLIDNNLITSTATSSATTRGYGITIAVASNVGNTGLVVSNNEITNFYARGINLTGGFAGAKYFNNKIYHTTAITQPTTAEFSGIYFSSSAVANAGSEIYNNIIYGIKLTNGTTAINGIYVFGAPSSGTPIKVYNNVVSIGQELTGTAAALSVFGLRDNPLSSAFMDYYNNSIYVGGEVTSGTNPSAAFRKQVNSTLNISNNIFFNARTNNGGTGTHWAVMYNASTNATQSNNAYFVSGTGGVLGTTNGTTTGNQTTLADWQTAVGSDAGSLFLNPNFVDPNATPPNLKINTTIPTPIESGGIVISGITTDFEGDARFPNAGYPNNPSSPATAPDIGADEFAGLGLDVSPPLIEYVQLENTASTANRTLVATITDASGIPTGANSPRAYFKKGVDGTYLFDNSPVVTGSEYTFTINHTTLGVASGDTVYYYVAAQDSAGNVGTNPAGGSGINPPGTTAPPTPNMYILVPSLSGTYTVGTGGNYPNLTAVANQLNGSAVVVGNVVFELTSNYDGTTGETLPIVFNEFISTDSSFTVTIRPATGVTNRVTSGDPGSNFAFPVINFVGGDNYILDGRPGGTGTANEWTIRNTRTSATIGCVVRFADDATNNTLRNLNLESQATLTTTGVIFFHTSASGSVGNSFNNILNNNLRSRTDEAAPSISNGILSNGTAAAPNTGNVITGNNIINFNNIGISLVATGNGPDWVISDNNLYNPTHSSSSAQTGISIASATSLNMTISGNFIGGSAAGATGTMTNTGAGVIVTGILLSNGVSNVSNNTIANITQTGTGTGARLRGIYLTSGNDGNQITGNNIYNLLTSSTGVGLGAGTQPVAGISVWTGATFYLTNIIGNTIYNLSAENTFANATTNIPCGMFLTNVGLGSMVSGNKIYDIKNKATGVTAGQPPVAAGIFARFLDSAFVVNNMISLGIGENTNTQFNGIMVVSGLVGNDIYAIYNSISIDGTSGGTNSSFGILRGDNSAVSPLSSIFLLNNILYNNRTGGGSTNYAFGFQGADSTVNLSSNYNLLFNSDSNTVALSNVTNYSLSGWKASTSGDANSKSKNVFFTNPVLGDLHLTGSSNGDFDLAGTPIEGITTDFDGDTRNANFPYMGADEAPIPIPVELTSFAANVNERDVILNWSTATESNSLGFEVERKLENENWESLSMIQSAGNSTEPREYTFTDKKLGSGNYSYRLKMIDLDGSFQYSSVVEVEIGVPMTYSVSQNYPNPFNPTTRIDYQLPVNAKVQIELYSVTGEKVATLVNNELEAGYYTVDIDAKSLSLASGIYLYRLISTDYNGKQFMDVKKMMLLK